MGRRRRLTVAAPLVAAALLAACTATSGEGHRASDGPSASSPSASLPTAADRSSASSPAADSSAPNGSDGAASCPDTYRAPDPQRPRMALDFVLAADHASVRGTERISFTPDRPITELVFRLTANTPPTVAQGNRIVVGSATADHGAGRYTFTRANAAAGTEGGLLHIPFKTTIPAGTTVHARTTFTVTLGKDSFDRFGRAGRYAYFASAQPLLAWQRGYGWHDEDLIDFTAESATSEAMDVDLRVTAPARDTVIASGDPADPPASRSGTRTWTSHLDAARDVSVAAGPFAVSDTTVQGVHLRVGAYDTALRDALVPEFRRAITDLSRRFGPFPFPSLSVARVPAGGGGIEYPSSILLLDSSRLVAVHETAHQWFYAMVGDSQSLHPWLDEAFAQYAEELVNDNPGENGDVSHDPLPVDASVESYGHNERLYYFTTYNKGAAALLAARRAAGPARWDAALRCYVARNAWRIVVPADFRRAIAGLPAGVAVLRKAGALR